MGSPFKQALALLKKMECDGHTMVSLFATKDAALIVLGNSDALQKMPGDVIKMWHEGDVLKVIFGRAYADVQVIWQRSFAGCSTLLNTHYTRLQ